MISISISESKEQKEALEKKMIDISCTIILLSLIQTLPVREKKTTPTSQPLLIVVTLHYFENDYVSNLSLIGLRYIYRFTDDL